MKQKRKRQVASANSRHTERRQAAKLLNELLVQVGADALRLNTDGAPCVDDVLAKVLRVLDRRCSGETVRPAQNIPFRHHRNLRIQDVFHSYSTVFGLHHSVFSF